MEEVIANKTQPDDSQTVRNENEEDQTNKETNKTEAQENIVNQVDVNKIIINENTENVENTNNTEVSEDEAGKHELDSRDESIASQNDIDKSETKRNEYSKEITDNSSEIGQLHSRDDEGDMCLLDSVKYETESSNASTNIDDLKEITTFVKLEPEEMSDISISGLFRDDVRDVINSLMAIIEGRTTKASGDSSYVSKDRDTVLDKNYSSKDEQRRLEQRGIDKKGDDGSSYIEFRPRRRKAKKFIKTSYEAFKGSFDKLFSPGQLSSETNFILNNLIWRGCLNVWATSALILQIVLISSLGTLWLRSLISWSQLHCAWYFKESLLHLKYKTNRKEYFNYMRRIEQRSNVIPFVDISSDSDSKDTDFKESTACNATKYFSISALQKAGYGTTSQGDKKPIHQKEQPDKHLYFRIPINWFKKRLDLSLACVHTFVSVFNFTYTYEFCTVPSFEIRLQNTSLILYIYNLSFGVVMLIETLTVTFPIKLIYLVLPLAVFFVRHLIIRRVFTKGGLMNKNPYFDATYTPSRFMPTETNLIETVACVSIIFWILSIPRYVIWKIIRMEH